MAPVVLDLLMERARITRDEGRWLTAAIRAEIWNVNLDRDKHPELLTAADFMPGAKPSSQEISDHEFIDRIQAGETFETPPEQIAAFRASFEGAFSGVESAGAVTNAGPSGRPEPIMPERIATNAIAGERPGRGVR